MAPERKGQGRTGKKGKGTGKKGREVEPVGQGCEIGGSAQSQEWQRQTHLDHHPPQSDDLSYGRDRMNAIQPGPGYAKVQVQV